MPYRRPGKRFEETNQAHFPPPVTDHGDMLEIRIMLG